MAYMPVPKVFFNLQPTWALEAQMRRRWGPTSRGKYSTRVAELAAFCNANGGVIKGAVLRIQYYWCMGTVNYSTAVNAKAMLGI